MSRFYLVEFRYKRQKRWHPWGRRDTKIDSIRAAQVLLYDSQIVARVVRIDTDAMVVTSIFAAAKP